MYHSDIDILIRLSKITSGDYMDSFDRVAVMVGAYNAIGKSDS